VLLLFSIQFVFYDGLFWEGDSADIFIPFKLFLKNQISLGNIPEWNPYTNGGHGFSNFPTSQIFYPLNYLFIKLDIFPEFFFFHLLHIIILSASFFSLMKYFRISDAAAGLAMLLFVTSEYYLAQLGLKDIIATISYMPLIILLVYKWIDNCRVKLSIAIGIISGLQFLAGHPQYLFYTFLISSIIFLCRIKDILKINKLKLFGNLILIFFVFTAATAPLLFSFYDLVRNSQRQTVDFTNSNNLGFKLLNLFNIFFYRFTGLGTGAGSLINVWLPLKKYYIISNGYFSLEFIKPAALTLMIIYFFKNKLIKKELALIIIIGFILSFYNLIFPASFLKYLPMLNLFKYFERAFILIIFAGSIASGIAFDCLIEKKVVLNLKTIFFVPILFVLAGLFLAATSYMIKYSTLNDYLNSDYLRLMNYIESLGINFFFTAICLLIFFIGIIKFNISGKKNILIFFSIISVLIFFAVRPPHVILKKDFDSYISEIKELTKHNFIKPFEYINVEKGGGNLVYSGFRAMPANVFMIGGGHIENTRKSATYFKYTAKDDIYPVSYNLNDKNVSESNITTAGEFILNNKKYIVEKNNNSKPPLSFIDYNLNMNYPLDYDIKLVNSDKINIRIKSSIDAKVLFRHNYSTNWILCNNGNLQPLSEYDNMLMSFDVFKGENNLVFEYKDKLFRFGLKFSLISLFLIVFIYKFSPD